MNWAKYTATVSTRQDYLSGELLLSVYKENNDPKTVHVKSGLGTNKTGSVLGFLSLLDAEKVLFLSDINRLLYQTVARADPYQKTYHLHRDRAKKRLGTSCWMAHCVQSLENWGEDKDFRDCIVVIDEVFSVVRSIINGDTIKQKLKQAKVIRCFHKMLQTAKLVITLDGNLNDKTTEFIDKIRMTPSVKLLNTSSRKTYPVKMWDTQADILAVAKTKIVEGKKVAITSDNATQLRVLFEQIQGWGVNADSIMIVDSKSSAKEAPRDFLANPGEFLQRNPDKKVLLFSPSVNRGFDIDGNIIRHGADVFDCFFGLFTGIIAPDQVDQQFFRLRSQTVERHLFVSQKGKNNPRRYSFRKRYQDLLIVASSINLPEQEVEKILLQWQNSLWLDYEDWIRSAEKMFTENFKASVVSLLSKKGCNFTAGHLSPKSALKSKDEEENRKKIRQKQQLAEEERQQCVAKKVSLAAKKQIICDTETKSILSSQEKLLPGISSKDTYTPEMVQFIEKSKAKIKKVELLAMVKNPAATQEKIKTFFVDAIKAQKKGEAVWLGGMSWRLEFAGVLCATQTGRMLSSLQKECFTESHPELLSWAEKVKSICPGSNHLSIEASPLDLLKDVAEQLGLKIKKQSGSKSVYKLETALPADVHLEVEQLLSKKIAKND